MAERGFIGKNLHNILILQGATEILRPFVSNRNVTCIVLTYVKQLNDYHVKVVDSEAERKRVEKYASELPEESFQIYFYSLITVSWDTIKNDLTRLND